MKTFLLTLAATLPGRAFSAPDITVAGTVLPERGKPSAIVAGPTLTFIISVGDQLGDYQVVKIERGAVTFRFRKTYFRVKQDGPIPR
jgi:hypothetical protein